MLKAKLVLRARVCVEPPLLYAIPRGNPFGGDLYLYTLVIERQNLVISRRAWFRHTFTFTLCTFLRFPTSFHVYIFLCLICLRLVFSRVKNLSHVRLAFQIVVACVI